MKLIIARTDLYRTLSHVQSVVERRNTIPILSNVALEATSNMLRMYATDMDIEIVDAAAAQVSQEGATTVPAHMFYDIVRKLPDDASVQLELSDDGNTMTVSAGRSVFRLSCLPREDFPELASGDLPHRFSIPVETLSSAIDHTRFAISTEETRYYLNGIYVHPTKSNNIDVMRFVATDGHRLARVESPLPEGAGSIEGIIIPRKTIGELRKLIEDVADTVQVSLSNKVVRFTFDQIVLTSKLIDGKFPDYERVIPANNNRVLDVDAKSFAQAVDRVATISNEKNRGVKLTIHNKAMTLAASSADSGTANEEIEVSFEGEIDIGFNARYLLDVMQQIGSNHCRILLADQGAPAIVQDNEDASALYVLMPMRV